MEFGVGTLGRGWTATLAIEQVLADDGPPHENFALRANKYAAKLAAESILCEPPSGPDLSDRAIVVALALCARPVRFSEAAMVREAFIAEYGKIAA